MKNYNWIKNTIADCTDDTYGGDKSTHACLVLEALDEDTNATIQISEEDIAAVAMKEGYNVIRVKFDYYGQPGYLILGKGYTLDAYRRWWAKEMDDIDDILEGAHKLLSLEDIYVQD